MRCVVAAASTADAAAAARPDRARLQAVRRLERRFPQAQLRPLKLARAADLDARADPSGATRVWLALEALQVTGSFKVRGALVALDALGPGAHVVAASAGNHGAAVSYAAKVLGAHATVCVPRSAPLAKRSKIEQHGAELVLVQSDHYDDAEALAKERAITQGRTFLSPYDDENVVLGNGTSLALDIVEALGRVPDRVVTPFGGGGLASGLAWGMAAEGDGRRVWGVQSEASCAMAMSLERGAAVERLETGGTTLAEGLEGGISADGFARAREAVAGVVVVSEKHIAEAMAWGATALGVGLEGSAATALVPLLEGLPENLRGGDVVAVLTGRNVDPERLARVVPAGVPVPPSAD
jgi:threonine dehydratase